MLGAKRRCSTNNSFYASRFDRHASLTRLHAFSRCRSLGIGSAPAELGVVKYRDAARGGPFDWKLLRPFTAHETVTFEREVRVCEERNDEALRIPWWLASLVATAFSSLSLRSLVTHTILSSLTPF